MDKLVYTKKKLEFDIKYHVRPVINISKFKFVTQDKHWTNRLINTNVTIKTIGIDKDGETVMTDFCPPIHVSSFIDIYSKEPVIELKQNILFINGLEIQELKKCSNYETHIKLENLELKEDEYVEIEYLDSNYIEKRTKDWLDRIEQFHKNIRTWTSEFDNISIAEVNKLEMREDLMVKYNVGPINISVWNLFKNDKMTMSIKPYGLWIIGANGRIDLLTAQGNYVVIDKSEPFQTPSWTLFPVENRSKGIEFTKTIFLNLIGL